MEKKQRKFEMTITKELWKAWNALRKKGDSEKLQNITGKSRPMIDRALNFGHVNDEELKEAITKFYAERKEKELKQANELTLN